MLTSGEPTGYRPVTSKVLMLLDLQAKSREREIVAIVKKRRVAVTYKGPGINFFRKTYRLKMNKTRKMPDIVSMRRPSTG